MNEEGIPSQTAKLEYPGKDLEAMSCAENYHRWIIDEFEPFLGGSVAEVGAGRGSVSGFILERRRVKRLVAFEPSKEMYPFLEERLRREDRASSINGFFHALPEPGPLDSIVYLNVLEHVPDDKAEMATAFEALKPGGHLLIFVPALSWLYSDFDRKIGHFRRYSMRNLRQLVEGAGFSVVRARYFDIAGVLPWFVNFVMLRRSMGSGGVSIYDKLVVPVMKVVEAALPVPIGKNLLLVAKKT